MKAALLGILLTAGLAAFCRWGILAIVQAIKAKAPLKVRALIWALAEPVADIAEIVGDYYDWHGEEKLLDAIERLKKYIGTELGPDELEYAKREIEDAVECRNNLASWAKPSVSFKEFVLREGSGGK